MVTRALCGGFAPTIGAPDAHTRSRPMPQAGYEDCMFGYQHPSMMQHAKIAIFRCTLALAVGLTFAVLVMTGIARAEVRDRLQGAWAPIGLSCDTVFTHKNGKIEFNLHYGARVEGFIVHGKRAEGAHAACKLLSRKEEGDTLKFVLACREDIIFDKVVVTARFHNDGTLERFDPSFPELASRYHRCGT